MELSQQLLATVYKRNHVTKTISYDLKFKYWIARFTLDKFDS